MGVNLFFVLSGYLGFYSYYKEPDAKLYYLKRAFRIVPLYYVIIILNMIMWGMAWRFLENPMPVDNYRLGWLRYFLFLNQSVPAENIFWKNLNATWTIPYFITYYFLVPFLCKFISSYKKSLLFLLVCLMIRPFWIGEWFKPVKEMYHFAIGILIYFAIIEAKEYITYIGMGIFIIILLIFGKTDNGIAYTNCFAIIFLASFRIPDQYAKAFDNKILKKLDKYSFTIYLGHAFAVELMGIVRSFIDFNKIEVFLFFSVGTVIVCLILQKLIVDPVMSKERKILKIMRAQFD